MMVKKYLNLGCGRDYRKDYTGDVEWVNLDCPDSYHADVRHNLDVLPYPFEDNCFDMVLCSHVLEHVIKPLDVMKEVCRILKPSGRVVVRLPVGDFTVDHLRGIHTRDYFHSITRFDGGGCDCCHMFNLVYQRRRLKNFFSLWYRFRKWFVNLFTDEWEFCLEKDGEGVKIEK